MAGKRKSAEEHASHERWLVSYADFITLLFAFFTTMYAIGESDRGKAEKFIHSVNTAFHRFDSILPTDMAMATGGQMVSLLGPQQGGNLDAIVIFKDEKVSPADENTATDESKDPETDSEKGKTSGQGEEPASPEEGGRKAAEPTPTPLPAPASTPTPSPTPAAGNGQLSPKGRGMGAGEFQQALEELQRCLEEENLRDKVTLKQEERGLVISLSEAGFFEPGKADLKPESTTYLDKIAQTIKRLDRRIQIDGHTDNTPIRYSPYSSNLELSVARAARTHQLLVETYGCDPAKVGAAGWGEWHPVASNATAEGRAHNRRVDIVILGSDASTYATP